MRILLATMILSAPAAAGQSWQVLDQRGREALAAGRYAEARSYFERELKLPAAPDVERAAALSHAGQASLALGESRKAEEYFRRAIQLAPDVAKLWHGLGQSLFLQNRRREAEDAYRRALADPSIGPEVRGDLAALLDVQKRHGEAADLLREAIATAPKGQARARLMRNLGVLEWEMGARSAAVRHLHDAVTEMEAAVGSSHPDVAQLLTDYADALSGTGEKSQAKAIAKRAETIRSAFLGQDGAGTVGWRELRK